MSELPTLDVGTLSRRRWLQLAAGGSVGLALDGVIDVAEVRAATKDVKLANVTEFTTSCNFCSCGCGMIASVRDGKLIALGGRLRPRGQPRIAVRQGHLDVRDARLAAAQPGAALPRAGQRPMGGNHLGAGGRSDRAEDREDAQRELDRHARRSAATTCRSTARTRSRSWAARRTPTRSATCSRRRCACSGPVYVEHQARL